MEPAEPELIDLIVRLPRAVVETVILGTGAPSRDPAGRRLALAKWILASRRRRSKAFGRVRFGEPAWDMILDLYVAEGEGRRVDVSGMCLASGVPPTTALRYVDMLVGDELIAKSADAGDGRRWIVTLGSVLRSAIDDWLDQADAALGVAGWIMPPAPTSIHSKEAYQARLP